MMGRPPINISRNINLPLLGDMPERIEEVQRPGENRVSFIREAIQNEIVKRKCEKLHLKLTSMSA